MNEHPRVKALVLLSGGLDSQLSVCVLKEQGIEVHGIVFESPFFDAAAARKAAAQLGVPLQVHDFTNDIIELINDPPHGFGSGMNPCIDCHARMLQRAGQILEREGFQFLATGEVLNERPMSQNRRSLRTVADGSGCPDLILRPLSAGLLEETRSEQIGWVDRARLLSLQGRSRKPQMELALRYGIQEYPAPAGGCRLTEPNFARRLKDLKEHEGLGSLEAIRLLRVGRHFRLADKVKVIVGRNEADNAVLEACVRCDKLVLKIEEIPGPTGLISDQATEEDVQRAGAICARYGDGPKEGPAVIVITSALGVHRVAVTPASMEEANKRMV